MLNWSKIGQPIARVDGGALDGEILYLDRKNQLEGHNILKFKDVTLKDGKFQILPNNGKNHENKRDCLYVTGASGSGKSYFVKKFIKEYQKLAHNKDNPIYMFSSLTKDESLDDLKLSRIKIGDNLFTNPITPKMLSDSCVIFDDTDVIRNKNLRNVVDHLRDETLQIGRHFNITSIITNHAPTGQDLKTVLHEAHFLVFFMANWNAKLKYLVEKYMGLEKHDIKRLRKSKSRWACYMKGYPNLLITEYEAWIPSAYEDDEDEDDNKKK